MEDPCVKCRANPISKGAGYGILCKGCTKSEYADTRSQLGFNQCANISCPKLLIDTHRINTILIPGECMYFITPTGRLFILPYCAYCTTNGAVAMTQRLPTLRKINVEIRPHYDLKPRRKYESSPPKKIFMPPTATSSREVLTESTSSTERPSERMPDVPITPKDMTYDVKAPSIFFGLNLGF